jgi:PAS domain S-box-containing protein
MMPDPGRVEPADAATWPTVEPGGRRLRAVAEMIPLIAWTADADGGADFFNRRWFDYTGLTLDQSAGRGWMAAVHPDDLPRVRKRWRAARSERGAYEVEHRLRAVDGSWRWFLARAGPLSEDDGRPVGWFGTCTDVDDRIRDASGTAERELARLRASEARFRSIVTATAAIVWSTDSEGRPIDEARSWGEFTGQSLDEYLGRGWLDVVHPEDRARASFVWTGALHEGRPYEYEFRLRRRDGVYRRMFERGIPVLGPEGAVREWIGTCVDVTEVRAVEAALRDTEDRLSRLADSDVIGINFADIHGGISRANDEYLRIIGYSREEVESGRVGWKDLTPTEWLAADARAIAEAMVRGSCAPYEKQYLRKDGSRVWVLVGFALLGQDRVEAVAFILDLTELKRAEGALKEADRRKDEFLAMLAHELRNPLSAIGTAVALARQAGDDTATVSWTREVVERQVRHLGRLVDDLLDVSRITSGKIQLRKEEIDASRVVDQAVEAIRPVVAERGQGLEVVRGPGPLAVEADPTRLEQILVNLLMNASKYTDEGGRITLEAAREGDSLVFRVADTGIGLSPEMIPRVFELFAQVDHSLGRSRGGLGIGLTLVRTLAEMHGGSVSARSDGPGRGSEFTVTLPASRRVAVPFPAAEAARPASGTRRVLVVDDSVDTARAMALLLKSWGHDVRAVHDGAAALAAAAGFRPEVVLLDIGLPGMDGYRVAAALRRLPGLDAAILIALTGYGQDGDRARSIEAGFDHHLVKPVDFDDLLALVEGRR